MHSGGVDTTLEYSLNKFDFIPALNQLARLCIPLSDLTKAWTHFTRILHVKPSFVHEEGTIHPINTVFSIKRLYQVLQHMTINVLPQLVLEPIQYKIVARNNKAAMSASNY